MRIRMFGSSDVGRVRTKNQDSIHFDEKRSLLICADGIGGRPGGEIASSIAVDRVKKVFDETEVLRPSDCHRLLVKAIGNANRDIIRHGEVDPAFRGLGTTINILLYFRDHLYIAHIGDSRTYLYAQQHFWQLTVDHNIEVYVERGWFPPEVLQATSKPGALVRALGLTDRCEADIYERKIKPGELYLTCSDGLSSMVPDHKIREILEAHRHEPENLPNILIAEANRCGGKDNITVIVSEVMDS